MKGDGTIQAERVERKSTDGREERRKWKQERGLSVDLCTCHAKTNSSGLQQMSSFGKRVVGFPFSR